MPRSPSGPGADRRDVRRGGAGDVTAISPDEPRRGHEVIHPSHLGAPQRHMINPVARVADDHLVYR